MAGDWIKVEGPTPNKPEVMKLARALNVTRDDAFGKAMRFWLWLDGVSVDGSVDGVTSHDIDAIVGANGMAEALSAAGWLEIDEDGQKITVPNFERHNGESAKARALKTKRQAKWRLNRVDGAASTKASPEKRREDKKERSPLSPLISENGDASTPDSEPDKHGIPGIVFDAYVYRAVAINTEGHRHLPVPRALTADWAAKIRTRLHDRAWLGHYHEALAKLPIPGDGWQPDFEWLIRNGGNVQKILSGTYDWRATRDATKHDRGGRYRNPTARKIESIQINADDR